ncbi:hypothetical protein KIPB_000269, partial [Kipferlia bialata]
GYPQAGQPQQYGAMSGYPAPQY